MSFLYIGRMDGRTADRRQLHGGRRTDSGRTADGGRTADRWRTDGGRTADRRPMADGRQTTDGRRTADRFAPATFPVFVRRALASNAGGRPSLAGTIHTRHKETNDVSIDG